MLDGGVGNVLAGALVDAPRCTHMSFAKIFFAVLAAILAAALVIWIINSASVENARRAEARAFLFDIRTLAYGASIVALRRDVRRRCAG